MRLLPNPRRLHPNSEEMYARAAVAQVPRLLGSLDREPDSETFGSFDREHWAWKFRDFPITMLQTAIYPLALLWSHPFPDNPCYQQPRVLRWIEGAVKSTCARQHRNGAFDSVAPYTRSFGVTLAVIHCLTEVLRVVGEDLRPETLDLIRTTVQRGCEFAREGQEDYAFISNHQALFALGWLNASELLNEPQYRARAEETIEEILRHQSPEGWYREYDGPDPGYESLGISYLAKYWQRTRSSRVLESLQHSIEFYAHCIHPDGSIGGIYGSRHTQLYFPAGFEILAAELPVAGAIAAFMRERLVQGNVLTPAVSDPENLAPLVCAYLEASVVAEPPQKQLPRLPHEVLSGLHHYPEAGLTFVGTRRYYSVVSTAKGGVCRIFDRQTQRIAYEDSGYVVCASGRRWSSQHLGSGKKAECAEENRLVCEAVFSKVLQELSTPAKFLLLRLMNLTLFRNRAAGEWLQGLIVKRLIRKESPGPLRLRRAIRFGAEQMDFCDQIELTAPMQVSEIALSRSFLPIHMGSAKYFHPSELIPLPEAPVKGMVRELNEKRRARCEFTVRFSDTGGPELYFGPSREAGETVETEAYPHR